MFLQAAYKILNSLFSMENLLITGLIYYKFLLTFKLKLGDKLRPMKWPSHMILISVSFLARNK